MLYELEQMWKQRKLTTAALIREEILKHESADKGHGITTHLAMQLLENLQLQVRDIHIRYEDNGQFLVTKVCVFIYTSTDTICVWLDYS